MATHNLLAARAAAFEEVLLDICFVDFRAWWHLLY